MSSVENGRSVVPAGPVGRYGLTLLRSVETAARMGRVECACGREFQTVVSWALDGSRRTCGGCEPEAVRKVVRTADIVHDAAVRMQVVGRKEPAVGDLGKAFTYAYGTGRAAGLREAVAALRAGGVERSRDSVMQELLMAADVAEATAKRRGTGS